MPPVEDPPPEGRDGYDVLGLGPLQCGGRGWNVSTTRKTGRTTTYPPREGEYSNMKRKLGEEIIHSRNPLLSTRADGPAARGSVASAGGWLAGGRRPPVRETALAALM